jgi:MFS family permease
VAANIYNTIFGVTVGALTFLPLYAVSVYGASTVDSGLIVTPRAALMFAGSFLSSLLLVRWGYRRPMIIGTGMMILTAFLLGFESRGLNIADYGLSGIAVTLVIVGLSGFGQGVSMPASNNACIELMPDRVSTITGVRQTFRNIGQALGIAVASIVLDNFGSLNRGFSFMFFGTALLAVVTIPCIFAMPRSP